MQNISILTGLRFFAAFHVVLYHNYYLFPSWESAVPVFFQNIIRYGESAVSFFFLLSGFILMHVYHNNLNSWHEKKRYLIARFAKIYPLYLLAYCLDIPRVFNYFFQTHETNTAALKIAISSISYFTMTQSWIPRLTPVWNSPAWSLSCEAFFYISFIFAIVFFKQCKRQISMYLLFYLFPITLYFFTTFLFPGITQSHQFITIWRSLPILRICEFFLGVILYSMILDKHNIVLTIKKHNSLFFWSSITLLICITGIKVNFSKTIINYIFLIPLFSVIILSSYFEKIMAEQAFTNRLIQTLGLSSYALYIIHQPIKPYLLKVSSNSMTLGLSYLFLVTLCSVILYYLFELPMQKCIKNCSLG